MNFYEYCNTINDSDYSINIADSLPITFSNSSKVTFSVTTEEIYIFLKEFYDDYINKVQHIEPSTEYHEKKFRAFYKSFESEQIRTVVALGGNQTKGITGLIDKIICFITGQQYKGYHDLHFDKFSLEILFKKYPQYSNEILYDNRDRLLFGPYSSKKEVALNTLLDCYNNQYIEFIKDLVIDKFTARIPQSHVYYWTTQKGIDEKNNDQRIFNEKPFTMDGVDYYLSDQWTWDSDNGRSIIDLNKYLNSFGLEIIENDKKYWFFKINKLQIRNKLFHSRLNDSNIKCSISLSTRFISSLLTKPFILLTGLSGSGKTKLAQAFAEWICEDKKQFCLVPVGADWTNREPLLGYPNALQPGKYVKPDNGVLDLIIDANSNTDLPFFLILDEMNLSHVERYFADFLSLMETGKDSKISLHPETPEWRDADGNWNDGVPDKISLPDNLFIIGTVNIDETTYMFSPKVLDRANVIEFRVTEEDLKEFLDNPVKPKLNEIRGTGTGMASDFLRIAREEIIDFDDKSIIKTELLKFFKELKKTGAEFGYRTSSEIFRFAGIIKKLSAADGKAWETDEIIDAAVLQKLLPKLHGSRKKLDPVLKTLAVLCLKDGLDNTTALIEGFEKNPETIDNGDNVRFKRSLEKILRMKRRADQDGFTSFAEA